ncbi:cytochrome c biogenesis protein ResB [Heliobacterium chlorum]|uniref:Cytochrome c biogenesis protein ResB n=1 Tax=Heliobacterium chlorum TaxID=2698 RepID=A0ABR7SXA0_HELCL|nr:cytochrome c biogenesis protein ResB [Heliobacterium chlorum]MBC9783167.1 cytochrome c biogenesis protein ResB [Heliobacterium chlorum]
MVQSNEDLKASKSPEEQLNQQRPDKDGFVDKAWSFFSSMKLGLFLLLIIAVASIAGTIIPQNGSPQEYGSLYSLYSTLGLVDMYHSWWFQTLLFLLAMNLFICSVNRASSLWRLFSNPRIKAANGEISRMAHSFQTEKAISEESLVQQVEDVFREKGYRVFTERESGKTYLYAEKGRFGIWGSLISHIGLLVILVGAVIGIYAGQEGQMPAEVHSTFHIRDVQGLGKVDEDFDVRVDDFKTVYRPDGSIQAWISRLTILDKGQELLTKDIEVNHPLEIRGFKIYQAFYGANIPTKVTSKEIPQGYDFTINEGDFIPVPGTNLGVLAYKYVPDFDPQYGLQSKSDQPNNPRMVYVLYRGKEQIGVGAAELGKTEMLAGGEGQITFQRYAPYTGLTIRRDPGVAIVWLGCVVLLIGLGLSFYMPHKRMWATVEGNKEKSLLYFGGFAQKNKIAFEQDFIQLKDKL